MELLYYILIGIVQGLTEFLPVSSSGHIELSKALFGITVENSLLFSITLHLGTMLSTVIVFRKDLYEYLIHITDKKTILFISMIVCSMLPAGFAGVAFRDEIEVLFGGNLLWVGFALLFTSILLIMTFVLKNNIQSAKGKVSFGTAFLIGIMQAVAIIPGVSRSGATICTALFLKIEPKEAARFSFLMVLPVLLGASLLEVLTLLKSDSQPFIETHWSLLLGGFLSAFITGWLACRWMINLVSTGKLYLFAIYCLAVGGIAVFYSMS